MTGATLWARIRAEFTNLRTLLIVCGVVVAADQATKIWAVERLMFSCRKIGPTSTTIELEHCSASTVRMRIKDGATALELIDTAQGAQPLWSLKCNSSDACLSGSVQTGDTPVNTKVTKTANLSFDPSHIYELRATKRSTADRGSQSGAPLVDSIRFTLHKANESLRERIVVVPGFFDLIYVENPGAAWSLFRDPKWEGFRTPFFHVISILAVIFITYYYRKADRGDRLLRVILGLVLGGAVGNYIDRIRYNYVVDFIEWYIDGSAHQAPCNGANHWPGCPAEHHWPTFNIADVAIVVGVVLLVLQSILHRRKERRAKATEPPSSS